MEIIKDLAYWKNNCEENYLTTPISVLRYITELEKSIQLMQTAVVEQSEQLCKHENYDYTLNNDTKMCYDCFKTFVQHNCLQLVALRYKSITFNLKPYETLQ